MLESWIGCLLPTRFLLQTLMNAKQRPDIKKLRHFQFTMYIRKMQHRMILRGTHKDPSQLDLNLFASFSLVFASSLSSLSFSPVCKLEIMFVSCVNTFWLLALTDTSTSLTFASVSCCAAWMLLMAPLVCSKDSCMTCSPLERVAQTKLLRYILLLPCLGWELDWIIVASKLLADVWDLQNVMKSYWFSSAFFLEESCWTCLCLQLLDDTSQQLLILLVQ